MNHLANYWISIMDNLPSIVYVQSNEVKGLPIGKKFKQLTLLASIWSMMYVVDAGEFATTMTLLCNWSLF